MVLELCNSVPECSALLTWVLAGSRRPHSGNSRHAQSFVYMASGQGNNSGGGGFSMSFTTIGPDGVPRTVYHGGAPRGGGAPAGGGMPLGLAGLFGGLGLLPTMPVGQDPYFEGDNTVGSGSGASGGGGAAHPPRFARLLRDDVHASNPFAQMMQTALRQALSGGGPMGMGGIQSEADVDRIAAQLFSQQQGQAAAPASRAAVASLPDVAITPADVAEKKSCAVCMEELKLDDVGVTRLPCGHMFHKEECLMPWLLQQHTCPVCRFALGSAASEGSHAGASGAGVGGGLDDQAIDHLERGASHMMPVLDVLGNIFGFGPVHAGAGGDLSAPGYGGQWPAQSQAQSQHGSEYGGYGGQTAHVHEGEEDEDAALQAAIRASLEDGDQAQSQQAAAGAAAAHAQQAAPAVAGAAAAAAGQAQAAVDEEEAELRALRLESLRELSLQQLLNEAASEGVSVDLARAVEGHKDEVLAALAAHYGLVAQPPPAPPGPVANATPAPGAGAAAAAPAASSFSARVPVPPEPAAADASAYMLKLRLPDGSTLLRRFGPDATLSQVAAWVTSTDKAHLFRTDAAGTPLLALRDAAAHAAAAGAPGPAGDGAAGAGGAAPVPQATVFTPANWDVPLQNTGLSRRAQLVAEPM
jgi:hypothetical protein